MVGGRSAKKGAHGMLLDPRSRIFYEKLYFVRECGQSKNGSQESQVLKSLHSQTKKIKAPVRLKE